MKTKPLSILAIAVLGISASPSLAQNQQTVQKLEQRVQQLEAKNDLLEKKLELKEIALDTAYALRARAFEAELKEKSKWILRFSAIIAFVGLGGLIGFFFWVKEMAQKAAGEKFDKFFDEQKSRVLKLIDDKNEEVQLKKNKAILVLTPAGGSDSFLQTFFLKMGFKSPTYQSFPVQAGFDFSKFDLVLFNNDSPQGFSKEKTEIVETVKRFPPEILCFYFGSGRVEVDDTKLGSANFRSQLYGNLINALRYQDLLNR